MKGNVRTCPVLATKSSLKCEKTNCSQITYKNVFCTAPKIDKLNLRTAFTSTIIGKVRRGLDIRCSVIGLAQSVYK